MLPAKPKILAVDDIHANLVALRKLMQKVDCEVILAGSGNEALALCVENDFALVLLDVDMPDMNGYEVARLLKEEESTRHIPIIFVTASFEDKDHQMQGYVAGAVDYIQKPIDDFILLSKVGIFLALYNSRQLLARELTRSEAMRVAASLSEARFRQALNDAPIPVMLHAEGGEILLISRVWSELSGYHQQDIPTTDAWIARAFAASEQPMARDFMTQLYQRTEWSVDGEYVVLTANGERLIWDFRSGPLPPLPDGRRLAISMAVDITQKHEREAAQRLALTVFNTVGDAVVVTDMNNCVVSVNPAFTEITGYSASEVIGQNPRIFSSGRHDREFFREMWSSLMASNAWQGEIWNRRKDGSYFLEWLSIRCIRDAKGEIKQHVGIFSDITKKKQSEELIWRQANFDSLTQLPNRRMFHDRLAQEIKKANRAGQKMALMFIDLDRFKEVNDTLGHEKGDLLLVGAAQRLSACVRETDAVARLGGDEFTVLLIEQNDPSNVERVAQEIVRQLANPFDLDGETVYVSASVGIAIYPGDARDIDGLFKCADQAMYVAKEAGRNHHEFYSSDLQESALKRAHLINDLRSAIPRGEFLLHYQPIVDLNSGKITKAEALIRWQHPVQGLVSPAEFIPLAEESGLIIEIGDWVFAEAARQLAQWRASHGGDLAISINVSPAQFHRNDDMPGDWLRQLGELDLPGRFIVVEITEGLLLDAKEDITRRLLEFRDAGIQVSLDDFGTGYSALAYLKKFDIDYLKIDQSFVRNLATDPNDMALCEAIIVMAHKLGLKVVAEGVETREQRDLLSAASCDYGQGFLFSRPLPAAEFSKLL